MIHQDRASKEATMCASFVDALMKHIMEGVMIPKVQIERAVGPILSMFIENVLTETLRDDADLSGRLHMICPEFPFKKQDNRQSTNVDWLMYNSDRRQLVFLELKTSDSSIDTEQCAIYHAKQEAVRGVGGSFLIEDLRQLKDASGEHGKYSYILENKVEPMAAVIAACHDAMIIYLAPRCAKRKLQDHADRLLTFSMLSNSIPGPFAEEWSAIRGHLCLLDESSRQVRNQQSGTASEARSAINFADCADFHLIMALCKKHGDGIIIGFTGGATALAARDLRSLKSRLYKWDHAVEGTGTKRPGNWIRGSVFFRIIDELSGKERSRPLN